MYDFRQENVVAYVLKHLSRVQMLGVEGQSIMTEVPKKMREIIDKLEIHIIQK
jgi:hypothetical protein